jgi:hypothetical protein
VRLECHRIADVLPVQKIWAPKALYPRDPPARVFMGLTFCRRCAHETTVTELVPPGDWFPLLAEFRRQRGGQRPDFSTTEIEWIPLESSEALAFIATIPAPEKGIVH